MTFELSAEQQAIQDRARAFIEDHVVAQAGEIDRAGEVPAGLAAQAADVIASAGNVIALVVAVEELAVGSGALAIAAAAESNKRGEKFTLPGLRGAAALDDSPRAQLVLAAVGLGLGRAALDAALNSLRQAAAGAADAEKPHWIVADAATALEAARMSTRAAAQTADRGGLRGEVAIARLLTITAARAAVDAAVRVSGAEGYRDGTLLERLTRDVRALSVILGTEEHHRGAAADALLPE